MARRMAVRQQDKNPKIMGPKSAYLMYLRNKYKDGQDIIITESYLRSGVQMPNGGVSAIDFGFQSNDNSVPMLITDNRVQQSDTFEVYGWKFAMYTLAATSTAYPTTVPSVPYSTAIKQYFPNQNVFSGTTTGVPEYQNLYGVYNGSLYVKIQATVFFEQFDMQHFLNVGMAQQGVAVSTITPAGVTPATSQVASALEVGVTPMFMINGSAKNQITLNLAESLPLNPNLPLNAGGMLRANFLELTLLGFKVQNGALQPLNA